MFGFTLFVVVVVFFFIIICMAYIIWWDGVYSGAGSVGVQAELNAHG